MEKKISWKCCFCWGFLGLVAFQGNVRAEEESQNAEQDNQGEAMSYASGLLNQRISDVLSQLQARYSVLVSKSLASIGSLRAQALSARNEVDKLKLANDRMEKHEIRSLETEQKNLEEQEKALTGS